jgi:hypothetical protein
MKIDSRRFVVRKGESVKLDERPTIVRPFYESDRDYERVLDSHVEQLKHLQRVLYAANSYALLVIFQGMDASGKDGAISHVMSGVNPQGVSVFSFKHPSATELRHDFLCRQIPFLPERGRIGIFNRSYYEEVLIVRVHPEILRGEGLPWTDATAGSGRIVSSRSSTSNTICTGTHRHRQVLPPSLEERTAAAVSRAHRHAAARTGNSVSMTFGSGHLAADMKAYEACLGATSRKVRRGTSCRPTTRRMRGSSCLRCSSTRSTG